MTNFRYNIAKKCLVCGKGFISDIFDEKDFCCRCDDVTSIVDYSYDEDDKLEIDMLVNPLHGRARVYLYD